MTFNPSLSSALGSKLSQLRRKRGLTALLRKWLTGFILRIQRDTFGHEQLDPDEIQDHELVVL